MDLSLELYKQLSVLRNLVEQERNTFSDEDKILLSKLLRQVSDEVRAHAEQKISATTTFGDHAWMSQRMLTMLARHRINDLETKLKFSEFKCDYSDENAKTKDLRIAELEKEKDLSTSLYKELEKERKRVKSLETDLIQAVRDKQSMQQRYDACHSQLATAYENRVKKARTDTLAEVNAHWVEMCNVIPDDTVNSRLVEHMDAIRIAVAKNLV